MTPDGDELTYSMAIPSDRSNLVADVGVHKEKDIVLFRYDEDSDWGSDHPGAAEPGGDRGDTDGN